MTGSNSQQILAMEAEARRRLEARDHERAATICQQILAADPTNINALYFLAILFDRAGQYAISARLLRVCVSLFPPELSLHQLLAAVLLRAEEWDAGFAVLRRYLHITLKPSASAPIPDIDWGDIYGKGIDMVFEDRPDDTARYFAAALAGAPDRLPLLQYLLALIYWSFGAPGLGGGEHRPDAAKRVEGLARPEPPAGAKATDAAAGLVLAAVAARVAGLDELARSRLRRASALRPLLREALRKRAVSLADRRPAEAKDTLYFFYDLFVYPNSYNLTHLLIHAEHRRRQLGYRHLGVVFVGRQEPALPDGDRASQYADAEHEFRLQNLLVPMCHLIPACRSVFVLGSRAEARDLLASLGDDVLPSGYDPDLPYLRVENDWSITERILAGGERLPCFEAPASYRRMMEDWLQLCSGDRRTIAVTLRRNFEDLSRNSQLDTWLAFARGLDRSRYNVIFVDDTQGVFVREPGSEGGFDYCDLASVNVVFRLALYELVFLNFLTTNGPIGVVSHSRRTRYIITNFGAGAGINTAAAQKTLVGVEKGQNYPWAGPFQRLVWEPETLETIRGAFDRMVADLDAAGTT